MNVNEIARAIIAGQYSNDELNTIVDSIKFARAQITKHNRRSLVIGTKVKFHNSRTGQDVSGIVDKIAIKFITVRSGQTLWRCPANMVEAI